MLFDPKTPLSISTVEQDSYMYQSVGSEGIELISRALNTPLICRTISGRSVFTGINYISQSNDEVEDLFAALSAAVVRFPTLRFVCSGAIMSDYQRIRVEQVASRLGLRSLAFLWRRNQVSLLSDMLRSGLDAIVVKVQKVVF